MVRVDAHQHLWTLARGDYGWLTPDLGPIHRDFLPQDLRPEMEAAGISCGILVQAAPTEAETEYLLGIAAAHDWVAGVVGWIDLSAPGAPDRIAALARRRKLVGLRPMLHDLPDPGWILRADVQPALRAMATYDFVLDAVILPHQIGAIAATSDAHPGLTIVIDHAAKPAIAAGDLAEWAGAIRGVATRRNVHVKLSGLLTEAPAGADAAALYPVFATLVEAFTPARMLWGSDWPVLTLAADYAQWAAITDELLAGLVEHDRRAILGGNAARLYGLSIAANSLSGRIET
ncbi:MAG: amidohydrolase [Sphingomonas sp.]|nr:MAG: amidohydrolase [Sphingomonas sp.]